MTMTVEKATAGDSKQQLLSLWLETFSTFTRRTEAGESSLSNLLDQRYTWTNDLNPKGAPLTVLAVEDEDDLGVVGCCSVFPIKFNLYGESLKAGIAGDFGVSKRCRVFGPALPIQRAVLTAADNDGYDIVLGYPNKNAKMVMRRAGFKSLGCTQGMVKILNSKDKLTRKTSLPSFVTRVLAQCVNLGGYIADLFLAIGMTKGLEASVLSDPNDMNEFSWDAIDNFTEFSPVQSRDFLKWRYLHSPSIDFKLFVLFDTNKNVTGAVAFRQTESRTDIVDVALSESLTLRDLMMRFVLRCRKKKQESVSIGFLKNDDLQTQLKKMFFFKVDQEREFVAYVNTQKSDKVNALLEGELPLIMFEGAMDV
ncbi:MAG: GNAT family N-acetyltransferase [Pseudomonadales bacterium]|nr:GNAT family N-acetyltransferase [Pseudomonadales bacterium]